MPSTSNKGLGGTIFTNLRQGIPKNIQRRKDHQRSGQTFQMENGIKIHHRTERSPPRSSTEISTIFDINVKPRQYTNQKIIN